MEIVLIYYKDTFSEEVQVKPTNLFAYSFKKVYHSLCESKWFNFSVSIFLSFAC